MAITHIPIETNPTIRPSRLHKGIMNFIWRQSGAIIRSYVLYQPLKSFFIAGIPFLLVGGGLILRFLFYYFTGQSGIGRYIQSVSIGGTLFIVGVFMFFLGLLGDAIRANRKVLEEILIRLREDDFAKSDAFSEINGFPIVRKNNGRGDKKSD